MKIIGKKSIASLLYVLLQIGYFLVLLGTIGAVVGFVVMMINPEIEVFASYKDFSFLYKVPTNFIQRVSDFNIVQDAISSRKEWEYEQGIKRMINSGAIPSTIEMVLFELLRTAKNPSFKTIQNLIK